MQDPANFLIHTIVIELRRSPNALRFQLHLQAINKNCFAQVMDMQCSLKKIQMSMCARESKRETSTDTNPEKRRFSMKGPEL